MGVRETGFGVCWRSRLSAALVVKLRAAGTGSGTMKGEMSQVPDRTDMEETRRLKHPTLHRKPGCSEWPATNSRHIQMQILHFDGEAYDEQSLYNADVWVRSLTQGARLRSCAEPLYTEIRQR